MEHLGVKTGAELIVKLEDLDFTIVHVNISDTTLIILEKKDREDYYKFVRTFSNASENCIINISINWDKQIVYVIPCSFDSENELRTMRDYICKLNII